MTLDDIKMRGKAVIIGFAEADPEMITRLREIGFAEGDKIQPLHGAGLSQNPLCVRINGALIALRRTEAQLILVEACQ